MSAIAERLLDAFFNRSLSDYRSAVSEIRRAGGLTEAEKSLIEKVAEPLHARDIVRQADPSNPVRPSEVN
jgi:hypothetical protein